MDATELLLSRNSMPQLIEPAPSDEALERLIQAACRAPDHAWLKPWRFLVVEGEARQKLGEIYAKAALLRDAETPERALERLRNQPLRAPMIITVVAHIQPHPKVPKQEQIISAGCAAHAILLAAHAEGFAGIWRTGDNAYDPHVIQTMGLAENEEIIGFLYLGTAAGPLKALPDNDIKKYCQIWE